jgi:hypothetical protein
MLKFMFCGRESRNGTVEGILLMISSGDFFEMTGDVGIKVSSVGVGFIVALLQVGNKFNWQQGKVGVGKSSHGGGEGCALSVLSFSIGNSNVGLVFSISTSVVSVSK